MGHWARAVFLYGVLVTPVAAQVESWQPAPAIVNSTTPFNFHLVTTEEFLNRFVAREQSEPGRIDDFIFGAKVDGSQWSTTQLRLDLRPSMEQATAVLVLTGQIQTDTLGKTEQGAVQTVGQQEFLAAKEVYFEGHEFTTRHATVHARATNQAVAAFTRLDGTILQQLGRKIALSRAEQQRPQTEAYARDKVVENVFPKFDGSIDAQLAAANRQLNDPLRKSLKQYRLLPTSQRVISTDHHLHYAARAAIDPLEPAIQVPPVSLSGPQAVTFYLHESLPNGLIDRLQLRGRKTTDQELKSLAGQLSRLVGGREIPEEDRSPALTIPGMPGPLVTEIEFDAVRPLEIRFGDEEMHVELRATFRPAGQDLLPPLLVTIPLRLERHPSGWRLVRGEIGLQSTSEAPLPEVAENLIRQSIESRMAPVDIPAELPIPGWPAHVPPLKLANARSAGGWVAIAFD